MWEDLKVYKQLDKKEIVPTFKKFGKEILSHLDNYSLDQTGSIIKIYRQVNQLELSIYIEKSQGDYNLKVFTCIKPVDFYRQHKYTWVNIVVLGDIMNNYRRSFYPLTQEWKELAYYIAARIKTDIEVYFENHNTYDKIIERSEKAVSKIELHNAVFPLLIYAAIKTRNKELLLYYIEQRQGQLGYVPISRAEYLRPGAAEVDEGAFLNCIKELAFKDDFNGIDQEINRFQA